jgi:hypothetical protein
VRRSVTTILGLGIVTAIFMAIMSVFYLQQIPTKEDLRRLEDDLRREHGLYLAAAAPLELTLVRPDDGSRAGVRVLCTLRPDIRRQEPTVALYLTRMAESVLKHPDWRGRLGFVTVHHAPPLTAEVTRFPAQASAKN